MSEIFVPFLAKPNLDVKLAGDVEAGLRGREAIQEVFFFLHILPAVTEGVTGFVVTFCMVL